MGLEAKRSTCGKRENLRDVDPTNLGSSVPSVAKGSWREPWSASTFLFPGMKTGTKERLLWGQKNQLPCNSVQGKREKRTHSPPTNKASKLSERIWSIFPGMWTGTKKSFFGDRKINCLVTLSKGRKRREEKRREPILLKQTKLPNCLKEFEASCLLEPTGRAGRNTGSLAASSHTSG